MNLIGFWILCPLTLWLHHPVLDRVVLQEGIVKCRVLDYNEEKLAIPLPPLLYVDCTKEIGWLDTDHPNKFWTRSCYE